MIYPTPDEVFDEIRSRLPAVLGYAPLERPVPFAGYIARRFELQGHDEEDDLEIDLRLNFRSTHEHRTVASVIVRWTRRIAFTGYRVRKSINFPVGSRNGLSWGKIEAAIRRAAEETDRAVEFAHAEEARAQDNAAMRDGLRDEVWKVFGSRDPKFFRKGGVDLRGELFVDVLVSQSKSTPVLRLEIKGSQTFGTIDELRRQLRTLGFVTVQKRPGKS